MKLEFYRIHCLQISLEGFIIAPGYIQLHLPHALRISFGQFRVSSHRLHIESGRAEGIPQEGRICTFCDLQEIESKEHFTTICLIYYAIRGQYHCLFRDGFGPLTWLLLYPDQRCLAAFLHEMTRYPATLMRA